MDEQNEMGMYETEDEYYDINNPDPYIYIEYIELGPCNNGKGKFLSIDGEKGYYMRYGFEHTLSFSFTPKDYYEVSYDNDSIDIIIQVEITQGEESLMDGSEEIRTAHAIIRIHLQRLNCYWECGFLGKGIVGFERTGSQ